MSHAIDRQPASSGAAQPPRRRRRVRRILIVIGAALTALLSVAVILFTVWANTTYAAEPGALASVTADDRLTVQTVDGSVVMTPTGESDGRGLVFVSGAKVEAEAYAATFGEAVAEGASVVIVQPFLNLGLLETRTLASFTSLVPDVDSWAVGGHSMGGVKACGYATDPEIDALVLLASYCSLDDLSERDDLAVLTLTGSNDGLLALDDLDGGRALLPSSAEYTVIEGASHAQFGAYGAQPGDGEASISDEQARREISAALAVFLTQPW